MGFALRMMTETKTIDRIPSRLYGSQDAVVKSVVFPEPGKLRSRKVVTRSRARSTGKYPSWKMGRMMQWESHHELNAFYLLDCDPNVTRFTEQPCEIVYVQDGVVKRHYPDILVEFGDRKELWEVKPESEATRAEVLRRTAVLTDLARWGYAYKVVLSSDLAAQPRLSNSVRLLQYGSLCAVTVSERESIRLALNDRESFTWSDTCHGVYGPRGRGVLCRLALQGVLNIDLNSTWSDESRFFPRKEGL